MVRKCHVRMVQMHQHATHSATAANVRLLPSALHALLPAARGACSHSVRRPPWLLRHKQPACKAVGFPGRLGQFPLRPVERQRPSRHDPCAAPPRSAFSPCDESPTVRPPCFRTEDRPADLEHLSEIAPASGLIRSTFYCAGHEAQPGRLALMTWTMFNRNSEETMKSKMLVILSTLVMALGLMAQNATQTPAAPSGDNPKACACCNHDQADGKMSCCGKDGKCGQMSKDGKDATMSHDEMMSKDGKSGMKCPMMARQQGRQDVVLRQRWWLLQRRQVRHGQRQARAAATERCVNVRQQVCK